MQACDRASGGDVRGNKKPGRSVVSKLSAIMLLFTEGGTLSLSEIAERSGLPMSTAHRMVCDLSAWRILERDQNRHFRPSLAMRALGGTSCCTTTSIRDLASPVLDDLCRVSGSEARFGILDGQVLKYIYKLGPDSPVSEFRPAATLPLHATALGKVLMAFSGPEIIDLILSREVRAYTPSTIVDRERIRWTLNLVRAHRFAVSDGELRSDYSAIAAPIFGSAGNPVAAIEVRVTDVATRAHIERPMLVVAAASLSRDLYRSCCCTRPATQGVVPATGVSRFPSAAALSGS